MKFTLNGKALQVILNMLNLDPEIKTLLSTMQ